MINQVHGLANEIVHSIIISFKEANEFAAILTAEASCLKKRSYSIKGDCN